MDKMDEKLNSLPWGLEKSLLAISLYPKCGKEEERSLDEWICNYLQCPPFNVSVHALHLGQAKAIVYGVHVVLSQMIV